MAYRIVYKKSVLKDLKKLGKPEASRIMDKIEKDLLKHPDSIPVLKGKFAGLRKYRLGDYRIIYVLIGEEVIILRIGNRKEVYNK
ncbi:MAG: type II toxin-antitoxin system RelE/ParE family toxin [Deltaproteobacteria bacterium]|nr:type II toxin-antitoxin system RelE/ParE family toxin [Deltaproteobacteria bacterium]